MAFAEGSTPSGGERGAEFFFLTNDTHIVSLFIMKLITKDTDYAVKALIFMANRNGAITSVTELTEELGVPRAFLRKILQILNKKNVLKSQKGQGGGFVLSNAPEKIFVVELMEIFQGKIKLNDCLLKKRICPDIYTCTLKRKIEEIEHYVVKELESINIKSLMGDRWKNI